MSNGQQIQPKIKINNKYMPYDTKRIIDTINDFNNKNYNFSFIFRFPDIFEHRGEIKIRIGDNIDKFRWDKNFLTFISNRQKKDVENLKNNGYMVNSPIEITLQWRMIIGLGAAHPQETSMTLHHIYGIPYIPGSAVKGVTRHWIILDKFDGDENGAEKNNEFQKIFGTQKSKGEVIFFDAYPVGDIKLKLDVMTPHYGEYYSDPKKKTPPADYLNPNPIKFLTVEKTKFRFYLASKESDLLNRAEKWLNEALKEYGIGAKTAIGYGYFGG